MDRIDNFPDTFTGYRSAEITHPDCLSVHVSYDSTDTLGAGYLGSPNTTGPNMAAIDIRDVGGLPVAQRVLSQLPPQVLGNVIKMVIRHDPADTVAKLIRKHMTVEPRDTGQQ